jgi:hypothetical protein
LYAALLGEHPEATTMRMFRLRRAYAPEVPKLKRRPLGLVTVLLAPVLALAGTVGSASASSTVTDGLLLLGTDAAYARFVGPIDDCHGLELFVGYVQADGLKSPISGGQPTFHSDVEAILSVFENAETEGCGSDSLQLSGVRGLTASDQVEIVTLKSATLDGFELTVTGDEGGNEVTVVLILDVTWTGDGPVFTEVTSGGGDHSAHRTVAATVSGTITIESVSGGGELATVLASGPDEYSTVAGLDETEGRITHYQQIIINLP